MDKLEVVNKKFVRVKLNKENYVDRDSLWFNIGSVDSFERNIESSQTELHIEPKNFVPVVYKTELEASSLLGVLPTLLLIGNCIQDIPKMTRQTFRISTATFL